MILLWGIPGERPLDVVRSALGDLRQAVVTFDQRMVRDWSIELDVGRDVAGRLIGPAGAIDLGAVTAAYVRPYDPVAVPAVADHDPESHAVAHARQVHALLRVWSELTPAHVVNRPSAMASNASKPYQAALIRAAADFQVPPTLVTTDPAAARRFLLEHGDVIYKSVSAVRSIVARATARSDADLERIACCPTQFQAYIAGTDVRVHVVGDEVFGCEIASAAVDYRYPGSADVALRPYDVPGDVAERCRALARALGLVVAGIDLRRTGAGAWFCFEVNPSPAFPMFDRDGAIARAVARQLASGGQS